jgi:deazaflavin-dependent oxidoreductase (nitroreductase family)
MGNPIMRAGTTMHAKLMKATGKFGAGTADSSLLALRHVGAKTGKERLTPVTFINVAGGYAVVASNAGAQANPAWYHNLMAHPETVVTVAGDDVAVRARETRGTERDELWARFSGLDDRWDRYQEKAQRTIPVVVLERV